MYRQVGKIKALKIWKRGNFENCTYGLITTRSEKLNNFLLEERHFIENIEFFCRKYFSKDEKGKYLSDLKERRLFAKNIPKDLSDRELLKFFKEYFNVEKAYQIRKLQNLGMGYGYIIFAKKVDAMDALSLARQQNGYINFDNYHGRGKMNIYLDQYRDQSFRQTGKFFKDIDGSSSDSRDLEFKSAVGRSKMVPENSFPNRTIYPNENSQMPFQRVDSSSSNHFQSSLVSSEEYKADSFTNTKLLKLPYLLQQEKYY